MNYVLSALVGAVIGRTAYAELMLSVTLGPADTVETIDYTSADTEALSVQYINAGRTRWRFSTSMASRPPR